MSQKDVKKDADQNDPGRLRVLGRLFAYVFHYRLRIVAGLVLALVVSLTNLVSLTAFIPIFNLMGKEGTVVLFEIGDDEQKQYEIYLEGRQDQSTEVLRAQFTAAKVWLNRQVEGSTAGEAIIWLCLAIFPVYLLKIVCITGTVYFVGTAGLYAVRDIRMRLYRQLNRLGIDYFQKERTGIVMSRIVNDVEVVAKSISVEFNEALINIFYILTHLGLLAYISPQMLFISVFIVPIVVVPVSNFATRIRRAYTGQQEKLADLSGHIQEVIGGIRVIRAFSMEGFERRRFGEINERLYSHTFKGHYFHQVGPALTEFTGTAVVAAFLVWGAYEITMAIGRENPLNRGEFFGFFLTLLFVMRPIKHVSIMINLLSATHAAALRIFEMMDLPAGVENAPNPKPLKDVRKSVTYDNVTFGYPGSERPALEGISFSVERGRSVALVGSSGAGKSTLVDLLPRLYDVNAGSISIDGVDIREIELTDLRKAVGIVSQDVFMFNATVRENIAYARPDVSNERVEEVSRAANAHEFIEKLPEGYDTPIGERGVMLSGGQRQRLAIARALLLDPPVLIFDEATSNLDNESELLVQQAVERLLQGRTVFIIAHRLSTIYRSDQILVLDQGRIVERGTHQELLDNGKIYRKLYEMQFADGRPEG